MFHMNLKLQGLAVERTTFKGREAVKLAMPASATQDPAKETLRDRDFMAILPIDFHDGVIEVEVASVLADNAPAYARGFIGVAFRIDETNRFESIYLRPVNARVDDQIRRNRTVQYVAYPDFTFPRLRKEEPGKYETYVDLPMEEWISMRIQVRGAMAKLYINGAEHPTLVVADLKLGAAQHGAVGLWIEAGTEGYFSQLHVRPN